jgi:flagellar hook-associated protein 3 FlgL
MMNRLKEALEDDDEMALQKSLDEINGAIDQVLRKRGQIGSTFKELASSEERIESSIDFKSSEVSKLEDMDVAKGAVDLNNAELKHRVALDSAARLIQPTLINFLR